MYTSRRDVKRMVNTNHEALFIVRWGFSLCCPSYMHQLPPESLALLQHILYPMLRMKWRRLFSDALFISIFPGIPDPLTPC